MHKHANLVNKPSKIMLVNAVIFYILLLHAVIFYILLKGFSEKINIESLFH